MKEKIYEKGITLIALVITIIVLLILAGVTLSIVFNGGIINKSQTAVDKYTEEQAKEKLSLALFEYKMDKVIKKEGTDLQTTLSKLGPVIEAEDKNYYEVEIDGYLFWVHKDTLEIISKGPSNPVPPTKIEFSSATYEANIGEGKNFNLNDLKLEPQNANPKFLKWSVNDESVAKIQNGVLTGLKEGTVIVTVTSTEDASITSSCTVTIKAIELTGISLNKTQIELGVNKSEILTVTYTPSNATYKDIVWSTSDDTIATVENGTIKGIAAGTATITATSVKNSSIKAECNVTVAEILEIATVEQLKTFRDDVNNGNTYEGKKVVLTNDLDLNLGKYTVANDGTVTFSEDAEQWTAIGNYDNRFKGTFDGQGHTISGLYINKPDEDYQGLFGYIEGTKNESKIENIVLKNTNIIGKFYVGSFVGICYYTDINKCYSNTVVRGRNSVGGIAGEVLVANVTNCFNVSEVYSEETTVAGIVSSLILANISNCVNAGKITGKINYTGGIIGTMQGGTCGNCYNLGEIIGDASIGGIISFASGNSSSYKYEINNCYNTGSVNGNKNVGGIIGLISNSKYASINSCNYLTGTATNGIGKIDSGDAILVTNSDSLPSPLDVLNTNGNDAWMEDANGNIALKFE